MNSYTRTRISFQVPMNDADYRTLQDSIVENVTLLLSLEVKNLLRQHEALTGIKVDTKDDDIIFICNEGKRSCKVDTVLSRESYSNMAYLVYINLLEYHDNIIKERKRDKQLADLTKAVNLLAINTATTAEKIDLLVANSIATNEKLDSVIKLADTTFKSLEIMAKSLNTIAQYTVALNDKLGLAIQFADKTIMADNSDTV